MTESKISNIALEDKTRSIWDINNSLSHEWGSEQSERAREQVSGASELSNGRARGSVLTSLFLFVPDHSAPSGSVHSSVSLSIHEFVPPTGHLSGRPSILDADSNNWIFIFVLFWCIPWAKKRKCVLLYCSSQCYVVLPEWQCQIRFSILYF